jgi:hypothetical protein
MCNVLTLTTTFKAGDVDCMSSKQGGRCHHAVHDAGNTMSAIRYKVVTLLVVRFKYLMVEEPARKHSLQGIKHHV